MSSQAKHITCTVVLAGQQRIKLYLICPTRRDADTVVERLYPEATYTSAIVRNHASKGAQP
jgi:hypothetical protein